MRYFNECFLNMFTYISLNLSNLNGNGVGNGKTHTRRTHKVHENVIQSKLLIIFELKPYYFREFT